MSRYIYIIFFFGSREKNSTLIGTGCSGTVAVVRYQPHMIVVGMRVGRPLSLHGRVAGKTVICGIRNCVLRVLPPWSDAIGRNAKNQMPTTICGFMVAFTRKDQAYALQYKNY